MVVKHVLIYFFLNLRIVLKLAFPCKMPDMLILIISSYFVIVAYGQMELLFAGIHDSLSLSLSLLLLLPHQILENQEHWSNLIYLTLIKIKPNYTDHEMFRNVPVNRRKKFLPSTLYKRCIRSD